MLRVGVRGWRLEVVSGLFCLYLLGLPPCLSCETRGGETGGCSPSSNPREIIAKMGRKWREQRSERNDHTPSTLLISLGPRPVAVRRCFGLDKPGGPTGPWRSEIGALVEGRLSLDGEEGLDMVQGGSYLCSCSFIRDIYSQWMLCMYVDRRDDRFLRR